MSGQDMNQTFHLNHIEHPAAMAGADTWDWFRGRVKERTHWRNPWMRGGMYRNQKEVVEWDEMDERMVEGVEFQVHVSRSEE